MTPIRILMATMSARARDLVNAAAGQGHDFEVIDEPSGPLGVLLAVKKMRADVVVLEAPDAGELGLESHLIAQFPQLVILVVTKDGAFVEQLCPRRLPVVATPEDIASALLRAIRSPCSS